jgi:hypothetical protein
MEEDNNKAIKTLAKNVEKLAGGGLGIYCKYFFLGVCYGLGATIGVALVLAIIGYVLRSLGVFSFVGDWVDVVKESLQNPNINLY